MAAGTTEIAVSLSAKDEVRALLDRLPDDVTLADIQYRLEVVRVRQPWRTLASIAAASTGR
jgi:hypothetical protein